MSFNYDLFVIGVGPEGLAAAERAATYGARVAILERDCVGRACVTHDCIPEKLIDPSRQNGAHLLSTTESRTGL